MNFLKIASSFESQISNMQDIDSDVDIEPESAFDDDDPSAGHQSDPHVPNEGESDISPVGVIQTYLVGLRETLSRQIKDRGKPVCYMEGHFWIRPCSPY